MNILGEAKSVSNFFHYKIMGKIIHKTNKDFLEEIYQEYIAEKNIARMRNIYPLYLYNIRVFRAYRNAWRLINRAALTPEEISIMKQLNIYKPSRKEMNNRGITSSSKKVY